MNTIDQRIVQMQFDNKQFESNTQTTLSTLDKLKKGLNLEASAKSLSTLDTAGKKFSLANISDGVDSISKKFSALGIIGVTALANITTSVMNTGKRMLSALTIDPIKTGLNEYETKMTAITTILTNTASKGTKLTDVNKALDELNTYADKTIYNFSEMTRNIGTFTAAGVDLKTSTESIKGIANLAAGSGSTAQQASTAMYQLSQAISSGSVKLQDWNSVVNAGMGGELFQKALEKTANEFGHGRDMAKSFRESLQDGWITSEVLTKTLAKMADDKSLTQAATQVKTFTQLFDTMKESVQSGWAQSWESIIGNKDEAATTLTAINDAFGDISGTSAKARNAMLSFWHDNGGREALIDAITNAFKGLESIMKPIKAAFSEIFPPMTGAKLVEMTKAVANLTKTFKMGDDTTRNLKSTFKGIFAILDIGKQAALALLGGMGDLFKSFLPAGNGLLSFTGSIGQWLVVLDESIKKSGIFTGAIQKVGDVLKPVVEGVQTAISTIIDVFKSMGNADLSGLDSFSDRVTTKVKPITKLGALVKSACSKIAEVVEKVAPVVYKFGEKIGKVFGAIGESILKSMGNANFDGVLDVINTGLFASILLGLKKFIKSVTEISENGAGMLSGIKGLLDGVQGCLKAYQENLKANILLKIAAAIAILAASLMTMSLIDSDKLTGSLVAMATLFTELFGSMAIFEKVVGSDGFKSMGKVTNAMIGLSVAVLILSVAMSKLAELDWEGIAKGLVGITGLVAVLVAAAKVLSTSSGKLVKGAVGLIAFAAAISILADVAIKISALDLSALGKGLLGVGVLMAELAAFMKVTDLSGMGLGKSLGLIALAAAISILATSVQTFGAMDAGSLAQGLIAIGAVLTELAVFVNLTGDAKKVTSTAIGLTILGSAMLIFAQAIGTMGNMSWEQLGKGLLTMAASLAIVIVAMTAMPKNMVASGVGLVVVASALVILSKVLQNMGSMSWEEIAKGLVTLAASLTIIVTAMTLMTTALPGAAALLIVSAALLVLSLVLKTLGSMSLGDIGIALLALVGVFVILGGAALILGPLTPVLLALSVAVALFGVACLAIGAGVLAFSAGLSALAISGTAAAAAIVVIVASLLGLIPLALTKLGEGLIAFCKVIADGAPAIMEAVSAVLSSIVAAIVDVIPKAVDALLLLLTSLCETIADYVPRMVQAGMDILVGFLKGVADNIGKVVAAGVSVIVNFLNAVATELPKVIQAGMGLMLSFVNGIANGIRNNTPPMISAIQNLMSAIIGAGLAALLASVGGFLNIGQQIMDGGFVQGIKNKITTCVSAIGEVMKACVKGISGATGDFITAGENSISGFIDGIKSKIEDAARAAADMAKAALKAAKKVLGIHSPSKEFGEIGQYSVLGFANGLKNFSGLVETAATNVGTTAVDTLKTAVSKISDVVGGNVNMNPTITPVLDLTDVASGAKTISSLLGANQGIRVSSVAHKVSAIATETQNGGGASATKASPQGANVSFTQYNYSPKELSRLDIYRQTKNQVSTMKGLMVGS